MTTTRLVSFTHKISETLVDIVASDILRFGNLSETDKKIVSEDMIRPPCPFRRGVEIQDLIYYLRLTKKLSSPIFELSSLEVDELELATRVVLMSDEDDQFQEIKHFFDRLFSNDTFEHRMYRLRIGEDSLWRFGTGYICHSDLIVLSTDDLLTNVGKIFDRNEFQALPISFNYRYVEPVDEPVDESDDEYFPDEEFDALSTEFLLNGWQPREIADADVIEDTSYGWIRDRGDFHAETVSIQPGWYRDNDDELDYYHLIFQEPCYDFDSHPSVIPQLAQPLDFVQDGIPVDELLSDEFF